MEKVFFKTLFSVEFNLNKIKQKCDYHTKFLTEVFYFGSIIRFRAAQGQPTYGVYIKLAAAGCLASRAASWRDQNLTFSIFCSGFLVLWKLLRSMWSGHSLAPRVLGAWRDPNLLLPLRVEARKASGCWRQDHWATAKAWEALTTESRCGGPRGTRRRALNCSSREGISPPSRGFGGSHQGTQGPVKGQGQGGGDTTPRHETLREQGEGTSSTDSRSAWKEPPKFTNRTLRSNGEVQHNTGGQAFLASHIQPKHSWGGRRRSSSRKKSKEDILQYAYWSWG